MASAQDEKAPELLKEADHPAPSPTSSSTSTSSSSAGTTAVVVGTTTSTALPTPTSPSPSVFSGHSSATVVAFSHAAPAAIASSTDIDVAVTQTEPSCSSLALEAGESDVQESKINLIYFYVGNKSEIALVPTDSSSDDIKDLFRSAAEAGPYDIVKLYTLAGRLINISPRIPPNSPSSPYRLEVVAVHCNGILMEQVGIDLLTLERRVSNLEVILKNQGSPCDSIVELKEQVNQLRHKLENYEHLSWLGFYKALHPPPLPSPPKTPGVGYHRKSRDDKQAVCDKFLQLSDVVLTKETCQLLREPTFDNWQWEDEEMLLLLQQMYFDLELPRKFDIEISILRNFLVRVYHHYNDVPFHNFRHCFCVTQMMFGMTCYVNLCERIGDLDVLILLTSCICHDLDHPGYNNIYQINAQTELALRYNDISPLENHHCSIAFRILEDPECNIFRNLPTSTYRKIREGIIRCILATDMARHNEIVSQFREVSPHFDKNNKAHINLLSMVLIKVADISNEARPMDVAEPWLDCLLAEFFQQSDTEKLEGLPVTPFMDRDKITKPSSQCSFIGLVLLPLFEALGQFFPELDPMIIQPVRDALEYYRRLNEASKHRKSTDVGLNTTGLAQSSAAAVASTSAIAIASTSTATTATATTSIGITTPSVRASSCSSAVEPEEEGASSNLCDNKIPSDPCNVNRVSRSNSVSICNDGKLVAGTSSTSAASNTTIATTTMNPITLAHRRASQLLVRGPSGSITSLRSTITTRSGAGGNFTSFPSLDSDSEREGGDTDTEDDDKDPLTEVAVSEKALKFKIATESSFDYASNSRKSSRENKSESSKSGSLHSQLVNEQPKVPSDPPTLPSEGSMCSLAAAVSAGVGASTPSSPPTTVVENPPTTPSSCTGSNLGASSTGGATIVKGKAKDSFFAKLKSLTERFVDSGGSSSGGGSPPQGAPKSFQSQGFNYFRKSGARKKLQMMEESDKAGSSAVGRPFSMKSPHRGSTSDPEGRDELLRRHHTIHATTGHLSEGERGDSELASPQCSPALSRSSPGGASGGNKSSSSSKQQYSGSLDSVLSKDEVAASSTKSPRKLGLPRFPFGHKKGRMGFMRRLSPKSGSDEGQGQEEQPERQEPQS